MEKKYRIARAKNRTGMVPNNTIEDAVAIKFAGQGRYNSPRKQPQARDGPKNTETGPLGLMNCFICDAPDQMARD